MELLQLYDKNKNKKAGLTEYKDLCIESTLSTGDKKLSFSLPKEDKFYNFIEEECYIETKTQEYVIKARDVGVDYTRFDCVLNLETLEANIFDRFESVEQTITASLNLAIVGTGWTVKDNTLKKKRTVRCTNKNALEIIQEIKKTYRVDIVFNTLKREIEVHEHLGEDKGTYFIDSLNLTALQIQSDSYKFATRIIAEGKDGLTFSSINNGKNYVENYQYSKKVKTLYWKDERYTLKESLLEDAKAKLKEISKPYTSYNASVLNLAKLNPKYKDILDYKLGDTITLISKNNKVKDKQRIVKTVEYPQDHSRDTVELANAVLKFEDIQQENQETIDTVSNITVDNGTIDGSTIDGIKVKQIEDFKANVVEVVNLKAINASIDNLHANKADIQDLHAVTAKIGTLEVTKANITQLNAVNAEISKLNSIKANIVDLNSATAKIGVLESKTASIDNLLAGNLTANNFKANSIVAGSAIIAENAIGSSQISSLTANKITTGTIDTSLVTVAGPNGRLKILGNKLQIFDDVNNKLFERIMLGINDKNRACLTLRATDGQTVLLTEEGLTKSGITDGFGKADDNSLSALKLDKNSIVRQVNGATETIAGTRIQVGDRTLDVELSTQNNTITEHGKELSSQKASLTALDNALKFKIDSQTFTQFTETINSNINLAKTEAIANADKAKQDAILEANRVAELKKQEAINSANSHADSIATSKANEALNNAKAYTNTEITTVNTHLNKATSEINVLKGQISSKVSQSDVDNTVIKYKTQNYGYLYKKDIIIHGDYNFYYPVIIKRGNQDVKRKIFINRSFSEQAPSEWNPDLATHHGGLSLLISANFGGWGGANYSWNIYDLEEQYSRMFAGAVNCASNMAFAIFLRGGGEKGAVYHLYSDQPLDGELPLKEGMPKPSVPQIAYNKEMIGFYEPAYEFYAPAPRTITKEVEEEIKKRKFIELSQSNATEITETNKKISTVESKFTQENNSIKASVQDLNSTTQTITTNIGNFNRELTNINSKVHNVESNLSILSNKIATKVSQSDIDKSIKEIEIGGRNYVRYSNFPSLAPSSNNIKGWISWGDICVFGKQGQEKYNENGVAYLAAIEGGGIWQEISSDLIKQDTEYTLTLTHGQENNTKYCPCYIEFWNKDKKIKAICLFSNTGYLDLKRRSYTFKSINEPYTSIRLVFVHNGSPNGNGCLLQVGLIKLEKGNKAGDWTIATEDTDQLIGDNIKVVDTKISDVSSSVTQLRDSVTTEINSINSKTTTLNGKIVNAETRLNSVEAKITDTSIINTVRRDFYSKGETDTLYAKQTQISQLDNKIVAQVSGSGGGNLIKNSNFNGGLDCWQKWGNIGFDTNTSYLTPGYGKMVIIQSFGFNQGIFQRFETIQGETYMVSFYAEANKRQPLEASIGIEGIKTITLKYEPGFKRWNFTFRATAKEHTFIAYCTNGAFFLGRVMVSKGEVLQEYREGNGVYSTIAKIDEEGITIDSLNSNTKTITDANGFKIIDKVTGTNLLNTDARGIVAKGGNFIVERDGNYSLFWGRDININGQRALVGTHSHPEAPMHPNKLYINYMNDFVNGVDIAGLLTNNGKKVMNESQFLDCNFGFTGHQKLPSGLILQWGRFTVVPGKDDYAISYVNFAKPFPNSALAVFANVEATDEGKIDWISDVNVNAQIWDNYKFRIVAKNLLHNWGTMYSGYWFAIGH